MQNTFWNKGLNGQTDQNENNGWDESKERTRAGCLEEELEKSEFAKNLRASVHMVGKRIKTFFFAKRK